MKGEHGGVPKGEDGDGDEDGDEVLEIPPAPCFTPPGVDAQGPPKRISGLPQGSRCPLVCQSP